MQAKTQTEARVGDILPALQAGNLRLERVQMVGEPVQVSTGSQQLAFPGTRAQVLIIHTPVNEHSGCPCCGPWGTGLWGHKDNCPSPHQAEGGL